MIKSISTAAVERPEILDENSPKGLRVVQLTAEPEVPCAHVYMEAQIFSPDSKLFLLERSGNAHGPNKDDPEHQYLLCDLEHNNKLIPITNELNAVAPSFSPDGQFIYYIVDNSNVNSGSIMVKRVSPDGSGRETLMVIDSVLPGAASLLSRIYPLSTISSDGKRLIIGGFLGDGEHSNCPWCVAAIDLENTTAEIVWQELFIGNSHPQYCRSTDSKLMHDVLIQHNHGYFFDAQGEESSREDYLGVDIHVVRDDGSGFRTMPWGRDGIEYCQGHQCWRGKSQWAITSTETHIPNRKHCERREARLIEGLAVDHAGHLGLNTRGAVRNDLTREFENPQFHHFATDAEGTKLISDYWTQDERELLYIADLGEQGKDPARNFTYLLDTQASFTKQTQSHPFLSPDGKKAFFNSDESGILQAYMIEGL